MEKRQLNETFTTIDYTYSDGTTLNEDVDNQYTALIDGENIIGMIEGQFFQPDGMSRNKRWYPRALWENVLASADVKNRLMNHTMFGEIGHSDGPVTDMTLRNGEASHIITDLWIDAKGRGMGRAYILNTQKGRDLKIYLGAGAKLKVSTRGEGTYLDGELHDGCPIIDPDSYELQTVDFVLNPGFLGTNAKLTTQEKHESMNVDVVEKAKITEQATKEAKKEGEMLMDMEKYVAKLEAQIEAQNAKIDSLSEELKSKEKELLEAKFVESAEIKKIKEEFEPFKKMGVSAKTIDESMKRSQKLLEKAQSERDALKEELKAWTDSCGTPEQVAEARAISEKALNKITEYQNLGSVDNLKALIDESKSVKEELETIKELAKQYEEVGSVEAVKELKDNCEKVIPKMKALESLNKEYKALGSVKELKEVKENAESALPKVAKLKEYEAIGSVEGIKEFITTASKLKESFAGYKALGTAKELAELKEHAEVVLPKLNELDLLEEYKKFGTPEDIKTLSEACEKAQEELKEKEALKESVEKVMPQLDETKALKAYVKRAKSIIEKYLGTVGSIKEAKEISETRKETIKKVNFKEALEVSRQFGCTVESAAKMISKYGVEKASKLLESAKKEPSKPTEKLAESTELVEEASQMDEAKEEAKEETITAKEFVSKGMITNAFNLDALGKKMNIEDLNKIDGTKVDGENEAVKLLKKYNKAFEVAEGPEGLEKEKTAQEAEKEANKIIKDQK